MIGVGSWSYEVSFSISQLRESCTVLRSKDSIDRPMHGMHPSISVLACPPSSLLL